MNIKIILYNIIILYILAEITALILIEGFNYTQPPLFRRQIELIDTIQNEYPIVADIDSSFGVWHIPNTHFRHVKECFDILYNYNSIGARDNERTLKSQQSRVLLIGDSFAEGYGVDSSKRLSNLLEKELKKEVLNFGTSGNFGSTQMNLLYQKFGRQYQHNIVLVSLLPRNDFIDDDFEEGKVLHSKRYRPYLIKRKGKFNLIYHLDKLENSLWHPSNINKEVEVEKKRSKGIKFILSSYSYFYQILYYIKKLTLSKESNKEFDYQSKYAFYTKDEIELLEYNLTQIKYNATQNNAIVIVFTIPSIEDITHFRDNKNAQNFLSQELTYFSKENNIIYIDLLPAYLEHDSPSDFFLRCDGHWSEMGNEWAKNILLQKLQEVLNEN